LRRQRFKARGDIVTTGSGAARAISPISLFFHGVAALALLAASNSAALAITITPTIFSDPAVSGSNSVNTSTGVIASSDSTVNGKISLRSAVLAANANPGSAINLGSGTYCLTIPPVMSGMSGSGNFHKAAYDSGSGLNLTGSLDITASMTISGLSQAATVIDAHGASCTGLGDRVMTINPYIVNTDASVIQSNFTVTLQNLTIAHGNNPSDDGTNGYSAGGAIWWEAAWLHGSFEVGTLDLESVTIDHNTTGFGGGAGGLVLFNGGTAIVNNSTFSNNSVTGAGQGGGGAIAAANSQISASTAIPNKLTITNTNFTANSCAATSGGAIQLIGNTNAYQLAIHGGAFSGNSAAYGGAIAGTEPAAAFSIDSGTTITGNTATGYGGGIHTDSNITIGAGTVISGNHAGTAGGGISIGGGSSITLSSIVNNTAGITGGGVYFFNGADAATGAATPSISFSRIVGNTASLGGANQVDNANVPYSMTDNWLGANIPGPNDFGVSNAVALASVGPQSGPAYTPTNATTVIPHGFSAGQMVSINGVANSTYDGNIGVCGSTAPYPGITNVTATGFTFCGGASNAQAQSSNTGFVSQTWQIQTATESGSTVTLTGVHTPAGFADAGDSTMRPVTVGDLLHVWGISNAGYNGFFVVSAVNTAAHTVSYTAPATGLPTLNNLDNGNQIGTAVALAKNISSTSESGSTVTVNTNGAHGLAAGNVVMIGGVGVAGYNGTFVINSVAATSFTYTNGATGLTSSGTGSFAKLEDSALQWKLSASPNLIKVGQTSALTGSFLTDSAGKAVSTTNLAEEIGLPVTWASGGLGNLSGQQAAVQSNGQATATFTATAAGLDYPIAKVDSETATALVAILFPPSISTAFAATHIAVAGTTTLTFTITNPNTADNLNGLAFSDGLPAGLAVANAPNASTTCGGAVTASAGSGTISFSGGSIGFNAAGTFACTVSVDVKGVSDGVQVNTTGNVTATDVGGLTGNAGSASITVINPPHVLKSFNPVSIPFGATSTLTIALNSTNTNLTLNGVAFSDSLPAGTKVATPSNLSSTCNGTASAPTTASVQLSGATLAPGASCSVSLTVQATAVLVASNSVTPTSTDVGGLAGNTSTATLTIVKANTATAVASSANPSVFGQSVMFTATISAVSPGSGTPTGTVTFLDNGTAIGTGPVNSGGVATFTTSALAVGSHPITAGYGGDGMFNGSTGALTGNTQVVKAASTTTVSTACMKTFVEGEPFTVSAVVSGVSPSGNATFTYDSGVLCSNVTLSSGSASCTSSVLTVPGAATQSTYNLNASYSGDSSNMSSASTSPVVVTVLNAANVIFRNGFEVLSLPCPIQ
jgi:hypothetical protein